MYIWHTFNYCSQKHTYMTKINTLITSFIKYIAPRNALWELSWQHHMTRLCSVAPFCSLAPQKQKKEIWDICSILKAHILAYFQCTCIGFAFDVTSVAAGKGLALASRFVALRSEVGNLWWRHRVSELVAVAVCTCCHLSLIAAVLLIVSLIFIYFSS